MNAFMHVNECLNACMNAIPRMDFSQCQSYIVDSVCLSSIILKGILLFCFDIRP